ncbi:hypothetical protein HYH03_011760 [Edaphochlamys debaryana]|uniref:Alpha-1,3-glucosyltransferase n=1 Tax=Edaphochlamys debaryana TaxID=47281 RepID=A0A835XTG7_9CHLO|nr:hypothetical protein HYH03_011760 [Edaphochlamys debaryana]|eukprot:KAG2489811.1 hypothetical protein HYH03_011760 [Edaphochlamys debaryana]
MLLDYVGDDAQSVGIFVLLAMMLRVLTGVSSYSGMNDPPKYGDYEAQRHWMELAVNLPVREWYTDSPVNNASYWPLDYPPLSGYQSWVCGVALRAVEPEALALVASHGHESPQSKLAMRYSVLAFDLAVYIPAAVWAVRVFYGRPAPSDPPSARTARVLALAALLLNPALLLIDHGHFQYNCISLGCTLAAVAAIGSGRRLLGAALFCLALNHKQMSLFYAPAFFAHLLGWALHDPAHRSVGQKLFAVVKLGVTVIATFALCWAPYLTSTEAVLQVLTRIFPVRRGLYEDYVANWWCATSLFIKWKSLFPAPTLLRAAAATTLAVAAPAMAHQIAGRGAEGADRGAGGPSKWGLAWSLVNSAFAFFMFSYQVHEKSILLPLLPLTLLAGREPTLAVGLPLLACVSMFPLLVRDGLALPYAAHVMLYGAVLAPTAVQYGRQLQAELGGGRSAGLLSHAVRGCSALVLRFWGVLAVLATAAGVGLHVAREVVPAPENLPWLHDRLFITFAFAGFAVAFVYTQCRQWMDGSGGKKRKSGKSE